MKKLLLIFTGLILIAGYSTSPQAKNAALSSHPLRGHINNIPLKDFKAKWENGILTLYTGKESNFEYDTRLIIFNLLKQPANQTLDIDTTIKRHPVSIHVNSKKHRNLSKIIQSAIHIQLKSDTEKDYRIPVRMHLQTSGKLNINLDGSFTLATSDLVSKNNIIDRSQDNLDTIQYIAEDFVKSSFPGKKVKFETQKLYWFSHGTEPAAKGKGRIQAGVYNAVFKVNKGEAQIKKMQLAKQNGDWKVVNVLNENQIQEAHKLTAPFINAPPYIFTKIAAQHFEKYFYRPKGGWKKIKEPSNFLCGGGQRKGQKGYCEVAYGVYYKGEFKTNGSYQQIKCTVKTYIFEKKNRKWKIEQILPANKKYMVRTGKIVKRKGNIWGC